MLRVVSSNTVVFMLHVAVCGKITEIFAEATGILNLIVGNHASFKEVTPLTGQKASARPPVGDEYSRISDEYISKSTCPMGRVEFAEKHVVFY